MVQSDHLAWPEKERLEIGGNKSNGTGTGTARNGRGRSNKNQRVEKKRRRRRGSGGEREVTLEIPFAEANLVEHETSLSTEIFSLTHCAGRYSLRNIDSIHWKGHECSVRRSRSQRNLGHDNNGWQDDSVG